jgi:diacylglycerol kinase (ATP)
MPASGLNPAAAAHGPARLAPVSALLSHSHPQQGALPMRVTLIVNPQAGRRSGVRVGAEAERAILAHGWEVTRLLTQAAGDGRRLAREAAAEADLVVGVGGDGTLSELLNGLRGTGVPCGLVPCGTGNDFARAVGIAPEPAAAVQQILRGGPHRVDLGHLVGVETRFVNAVGVGFDAAVAERINRRRRLTGGLVAYLPSITAELAHLKRLEATVQVDGERFEGSWLLVAVANGTSYGAGLKIAPHARCDDGLLDVVLVEQTGRADVLRSLRLVMRGAHESHPKVRMLQGRWVSIEAETPSPALVDGDVIAQTPLEIEVEPGAGVLWK